MLPTHECPSWWHHPWNSSRDTKWQTKRLFHDSTLRVWDQPGKVWNGSPGMHTKYGSFSNLIQLIVTPTSWSGISIFSSSRNMLSMLGFLSRCQVPIASVCDVVSVPETQARLTLMACVKVPDPVWTYQQRRTPVHQHWEHYDLATFLVFASRGKVPYRISLVGQRSTTHPPGFWF